MDRRNFLKKLGPVAIAPAALLLVPTDKPKARTWPGPKRIAPAVIYKFIDPDEDTTVFHSHSFCIDGTPNTCDNTTDGRWKTDCGLRDAEVMFGTHGVEMDRWSLEDAFTHPWLEGTTPCKECWL